MKQLFLLLIFLTSVMYIEAQDKALVSDILFEGNGTTSKDFLMKIIGIKIGDTWDPSMKNAVLSNINAWSYIIETSNLTESYTDEGVVLTIKIQEKLPFIVIPFFTYSNSSGFTPKLIFRHYNFAGWGKYFGTKLEFKPTSALGLFFEYKDFALFNIKNLNFGLSLAGTTSTPNYNITEIKPIGVFEWPENAPWNSEDKNVISSAVSLNYTDPLYDIKINTSASFSFEGLNESDPDKIQTRYLRPVIKTGIIVPLTSYVHFGANLDYNQETEFTESTNLNVSVEHGKIIDFYHWFKNKYNPVLSLAIGFPNTEQAYNIILQFVTSYTTLYNQVITSKDVSLAPENLYKSANSYYLDFGLVTTFTKRFYFNPNLSNSLSLNNTIIQRAFDYNDFLLDYVGVNAGYEPWKNVANTIKMSVWLTNQLDYRFYKRHYFSTKFRLFYYYNDVNTFDDFFKTNARTISQVEKAVYEVDADYSPGSNVGDFEGYAGAMLHLFYRIPLFTFTTPSFLTYRIDRELIWDAFFSFFIDIGLAQNYTSNNAAYAPYYLKLGTEKMNLFPGLGAGVKFEVVPKFVPALVVVEVGADIYKIIRSKSLSGKISFTFGIDNQ